MNDIDNTSLTSGDILIRNTDDDAWIPTPLATIADDATVGIGLGNLNDVTPPTDVESGHVLRGNNDGTTVSYDWISVSRDTASIQVYSNSVSYAVGDVVSLSDTGIVSIYIALVANDGTPVKTPGVDKDVWELIGPEEIAEINGVTIAADAAVGDVLQKTSATADTWNNITPAAMAIAGINFTDLQDINGVTAATADQFLKRNSSNDAWEFSTLSNITNQNVNGVRVRDLNNVNNADPSDTELLQYDEINSTYNSRTVDTVLESGHLESLGGVTPPILDLSNEDNDVGRVLTARRGVGDLANYTWENPLHASVPVFVSGTTATPSKYEVGDIAYTTNNNIQKIWIAQRTLSSTDTAEASGGVLASPPGNNVGGIPAWNLVGPGEVDELDDVSLTSIAEGNILRYDADDSAWKNVAFKGTGVNVGDTLDVSFKSEDSGISGTIDASAYPTSSDFVSTTTSTDDNTAGVTFSVDTTNTITKGNITATTDVSHIHTIAISDDRYLHRRTDWSDTAAYLINDIITSNGGLYRSVVNTAPAFVVGQTYMTNDVVAFESVLYRFDSATDGATSTDPAQDSRWVAFTVTTGRPENDLTSTIWIKFLEVSEENIPEHRLDRAYSSKELVSYGGSLYEAKTSVPVNGPVPAADSSNVSVWEPFAVLSTFDRSWKYSEGDVVNVLGTKARRTNVAYTASDWDDATGYGVGGVVFYNNYIWSFTGTGMDSSTIGTAPPDELSLWIIGQLVEDPLSTSDTLWELAPEPAGIPPVTWTEVLHPAVPPTNSTTEVVAVAGVTADFFPGNFYDIGNQVRHGNAYYHLTRLYAVPWNSTIDYTEIGQVVESSFRVWQVIATGRGVVGAVKSKITLAFKGEYHVGISANVEDNIYIDKIADELYDGNTTHHGIVLGSNASETFSDTKRVITEEGDYLHFAIGEGRKTAEQIVDTFITVANDSNFEDSSGVPINDDTYVENGTWVKVLGEDDTFYAVWTQNTASRLTHEDFTVNNSILTHFDKAPAGYSPVLNSSFYNITSRILQFKVINNSIGTDPNFAIGQVVGGGNGNFNTIFSPAKPDWYGTVRYNSRVGGVPNERLIEIDIHYSQVDLFNSGAGLYLYIPVDGNTSIVVEDGTAGDAAGERPELNPHNSSGERLFKLYREFPMPQWQIIKGVDLVEGLNLDGLELQATTTGGVLDSVDLTSVTPTVFNTTTTYVAGNVVSYHDTTVLESDGTTVASSPVIYSTNSDSTGNTPSDLNNNWTALSADSYSRDYSDGIFIRSYEENKADYVIDDLVWFKGNIFRSVINHTSAGGTVTGSTLPLFVSSTANLLTFSRTSAFANGAVSVIINGVSLFQRPALASESLEDFVAIVASTLNNLSTYTATVFDGVGIRVFRTDNTAFTFSLSAPTNAGGLSVTVTPDTTSVWLLSTNSEDSSNNDTFRVIEGSGVTVGSNYAKIKITKVTGPYHDNAHSIQFLFNRDLYNNTSFGRTLRFVFDSGYTPQSGMRAGSLDHLIYELDNVNSNPESIALDIVNQITAGNNATDSSGNTITDLVWAVNANIAPHEPDVIEFTSPNGSFTPTTADANSSNSQTGYVDGNTTNEALGWYWDSVTTRTAFTNVVGQVFTQGSTVFYGDNLYMCRVSYTTAAVFDEAPDRDDVRWKLLTK